MSYTRLKALLLFLLSIACIHLSAQTYDETVKSVLESAKEQTSRSVGPPVIGNEKGLPYLFSADSLAKVTNDTIGQAATSEQIAMYYYRIDPDKSIRYYQAAYPLYVAVNNKKRAAQCLQNLAFVNDEQKHDSVEAIKYTKMAIKARRELKDTLGTANMCKYLGFLQGKTHEFAEARKNVAEAIQLFSLKKYLPGVAVSYRDLATVYEQENKPDSCIANINLAKNIWNEHRDTSRIFGANTILLRVYTAENKLQDADNIFHQSESLSGCKRIHYEDMLDYYKTCQAYFTKKNDAKMAKEYRDKYHSLEESQKQQDKNKQ